MEKVVSCLAAAMTGTGTGAIATVQVFGDSAQAVLTRVFKPASTKSTEFKSGQILFGAITNDDKTIDQVTIGCEAPGTFAIHCHGNPLIVEMIMEQLRHCGATLTTAEQLRTRILTAQKPKDTIAIEANLAQPKAKTLQGTKIIANQIDAGLGKRARDWLGEINEISLDEIKAEAMRILQASQTAKLIVSGCTVVLTGPPNSGKSTLLNRLAGRQKAIVTDVKGTTRDWVETTCRIGSLSITLIDTAGLENEFDAPLDAIRQAAQKKTAEMLNEADLVLFVLDNSQPAQELDHRSAEMLTAKKVITVLNKSDLPSRFDIRRLPKTLSNIIKISAKEETGIEDLKQKIRQTSGAVDFDLHQSVCFTSRQENLLGQLTNAQSKQQAVSTIGDLLNGQV